MNKRFSNIIDLWPILILVFLGILVQAFGFVLLGIVLLLLLLFLGIPVYSYIAIYCNGIILKRRLRKSDRVITLEDAKHKLSKGQGSIIVEAPTLGWNVNYLWWSPDSNLNESKFDFEDNREDFMSEACQNYDKYISEETGIAKLIDIFVITQRTKKHLKKHFGHHDICFVPSAMVWLHRESEKKQKDK